MSIATKNKSFKLDIFQEQAIKSIEAYKSLIVSAPTGSGKTIIAKEAIKSALKKGKKAFYTAPLKALINQKYHEFSKEFGEDKIGIITGDTNKNRDSQIIVMTTEIYRNMLYGTSFGSIDPFLADLEFVIFDEFHFINDSSRGTVWEESIIYTPQSIKIIALSATINNPKELQNWIEEVHGDCDLVESSERPVPLFHYLYKDKQLNPLLTPNGTLNPKFKERNDNKFAKNKPKFTHNNFEQNSIPDLILELQKKNFLPAIYFVFSRKGCDKAVNDCRNLDLLSKEEREELNLEIDKSIASAPVLAKFAQLDSLRRGIATHHAGLLPQVKSLIEELFAKNLIKVVFSTETLAAGINMPARSTVISNISKISDEGFRTLTASEFLQMSGRAGRRGMDENGYVITVKNSNYSPNEIANLASAKPEDVKSHYTASYEMVLNLLQNHDYTEVKNLVERSFGQYLVKNTLTKEENDLEILEKQIIELQHPLCPAEIGDLNYYQELQNKLDENRKQKKLFEKNLDPRVEEIEASIEMLTMEAKAYPCNGCHKQKPCSKQMDKIKRYRKQSKTLEHKIQSIKNMCWENFEKVVNLLEKENYLDFKKKPTSKGLICASLRTDNSYFITELILNDMLKGLTAIEFAGLISCFVIGESKMREKSYSSLSKVVIKEDKNFRSIARLVIQKQRNYGIDKSVEINPNLSNTVEEWAKGISWEELSKNSLYDEGDILRALRRTSEMLKQITKAPNISQEIQNISLEATKLLERDLVIESLN